MLAKALANEIEIPMIYKSGSEFVEEYVGVGSARVRNLFKEAQSHELGCIIFIDELEAIGIKRTNDLSERWNHEHHTTIN